MAKDIKDFIHLYLGQFCSIEWTHSQREDGTYRISWFILQNLRPLSDMTEEEAVDIAIIMYGQPDSVKWRMEDKGNYFNVYRKHYSESFTIDKASGDIDRYAKEGDQMELQTTLQHHFITHFLLSKGFDLFNLIPEGLAIDKSKLPVK